LEVINILVADFHVFALAGEKLTINGVILAPLLGENLS
jgi:hypothetical protein